MRKKLIMLATSFFLSFAIMSGTHATVSELRFGSGKSPDPTSPPTIWAVRKYPDFISTEYQKHQMSFDFYAGDYICFEIGFANIDGPASVLIDKIELTGPSGELIVSNPGFESGSSGWSVWGSHYAEGEFTISTEAYEGSNAGKLTLLSTGTYSIHGQVPVSITQSGTYTLSAYTRVKEDQREIPPDDIFAMEVANQWVYEGNIKREIVELDQYGFERDTFKLRISQNDIQIGNEWYEVWKGYSRLWGITSNSSTFRFDEGLLVGWIPAAAGESKRSLAWVLNYNTEVYLTATFLGTEQVALSFDTFEAYRFRYDFTFTGPGGTSGTTYDWWFVPYVGVVKEQTLGGAANLVSFSIAGGRVSEVSDNDQDGLKDYQELIRYRTDWQKMDTDEDGMDDGWEVKYTLNPVSNDASGDKDRDGFSNVREYRAGTDPTDPASKPSPAVPWLHLLLLD